MHNISQKSMFGPLNTYRRDLLDVIPFFLNSACVMPNNVFQLLLMELHGLFRWQICYHLLWP